MSRTFLFGLSLLAAKTLAQQQGAYTPEVHPLLPTQTCTRAHGCQTQNTSVVLDAAYRWTHNVGGFDQCGPGTDFCPNVRLLRLSFKTNTDFRTGHRLCSELRPRGR
jgi:cellulose 1,4-beta-cellobiosidase